ncbi:Peptidyl-prolyl cis-trans isomerase-like 4 [Clonorchis sinensis]|uniref:peptidylprolyl isomerase n=1 Tax=Clonorchis sinensis TaxID=79923 RepID=A0A419QG18_CLOSI|nr:Peptidyl-prolyl cis-trans isomerase-like 4 [Clonorchis sinensis]
MSVLIETSLGVIVVDLFLTERPKCSLNFIKLCQMKHYNFCTFHSVQKNLVAQTGDPTGTGRGGFSVFTHLYGEQARYFDAEKKPKISHATRGLVSMVENGHGQHGSQFFITLADDLPYLDNKHTVFGRLAEGLEFIDKINEVFCDKENRPFRNIRIHHTIVLDDPFDTPKALIYPKSPERFPKAMFGDGGIPRIEEDEELDEEVGLSPTRLKEVQAEQEAKTHAQLLTLIGDLPDADVKPPDNVLFVCRLNPVTTSEDLEIIFSRFGEIKSCEVIRDRRTGASLQYAFVEFENESDCENAYFKMDKVIIDDRRIHVDFSQSVAKEWQKYRREQKAVVDRDPKPPRPNRGHSRHEPSHRHEGHERNRSPRASRRFEKRLPQDSKRTRSPVSSHPKEDVGSPKHKPLPGADLDLVVSGSDELSSSSSSLSSSHAKKKKKHRKHSSTTSSGSELRSLAEKVDSLLNTFNVVDRTTLLSRILSEFRDNMEMKQYVFDTKYLYLVLELLTSYSVPNIRFSLSANAGDSVKELLFSQFRQCTPHLVSYYKKCTVTDVLLSYLGLSINIKDSIRLLRLLNRPKRGLERETFYTLRLLTRQSNLSATQIAMSFVTLTQLGGSQDIYALLKPWSSGLHHLVDCLAKCQDALSGVTDELVLVTTGSGDRMNLEDACSAVKHCIRTAGQILRKPLIGAKTCPGDSDYDTVFTASNINEALERLNQKLARIMNSTTLPKFCDETPGRSLSRGGSLRGRAAARLGRYLLVVSEQRSELSNIITTQPCGEFSATPMSSRLPQTPSATIHPAVTTPTTEGRGDQLLRMFLSPQTPSVSHQAVEANNKNSPGSTAPAPSLIPDLTDETSMPERPVFSLYQTNLDWADAGFSPPPRRSSLTRTNNMVGDWNSQSMPAWSERRLGRVPLIETQASVKTLSNVSTPTKVRTSPVKKPRTLFADGSTGSAVTAESVVRITANTKSQQNKGANTRKKRLPNSKVDGKQRSLTDFFRI